MRSVTFAFGRPQELHIDNISGFNKGFEALMGELGLSRKHSRFESLKREDLVLEKPYTSGDSSVSVINYTPSNEDGGSRHVALVNISSRNDNSFQNIITEVSHFYITGHGYEDLGSR